MGSIMSIFFFVCLFLVESLEFKRTCFKRRPNTWRIVFFSMKDLQTGWCVTPNAISWLFNAFNLSQEFSIFLYFYWRGKRSRIQIKSWCFQSEYSSSRLGVRACVVLAPLLGVTWLIGFLAPLHIAFSYIFVILNSTQVKSSTTFCSWVEIRAYLRRDACQK